MPELKEVFDMVTKQTEPDLGAWNDQEQRQRRTSRNRRIGAFALVAAIAAVAAVIAINAMRPDDGDRTIVGTDTKTATPSGPTTSISPPGRRRYCPTRCRRPASTRCRRTAR